MRMNVSCEDLGNGIPGKGENKCRSLEVGKGSACSQKRMEIQCGWIRASKSAGNREEIRAAGRNRCPQCLVSLYQG